MYINSWWMVKIVKKIIFIVLSVLIFVACKGKDTVEANNQTPIANENSKLASAKNIEGSTWRGVEGESTIRQYSFLPNGVLRLTWMGVNGDQQQDNDNGSWTQNGNEIYFQFNDKNVENIGRIFENELKGQTRYKDGIQRDFNFSEIDIATTTPLVDYIKEKRQQYEAEKEKLTKLNCTKMNSWAADSRELIGKALSVSMSSISFVRGELGSTGRCLVVADTPKGPVRCVVFNILQDKETKEYFADLGAPFAIQAVCGGLAF